MKVFLRHCPLLSSLCVSPDILRRSKKRRKRLTFFPLLLSRQNVSKLHSERIYFSKRKDIREPVKCTHSWIYFFSFGSDSAASCVQIERSQSKHTHTHTKKAEKKKRVFFVIIWWKGKGVGKTHIYPIPSGNTHIRWLGRGRRKRRESRNKVSRHRAISLFYLRKSSSKRWKRGGIFPSLSLAHMGDR